MVSAKNVGTRFAPMTRVIWGGETNPHPYLVSMRSKQAALVEDLVELPKVRWLEPEDIINGVELDKPLEPEDM